MAENDPGKILEPKVILLVFIHGFKGDDTTFRSFPDELAALLRSRFSDTALLNEHPTSRPAALYTPPIFKHLLYPPFETRGDLSATVHCFRSWLLEKVIDSEVARGTASPTLTPGVGVVIVGHSMGGIVGAEAMLGIAGENNIETEGRSHEHGSSEPSAMDAANPSDSKDEGAENADEPPSHEDSEQQHQEGATSPNSQKGEEMTQAKMFPRVLGLLAFDTPFLGVAPGVFRHGMEEQYREKKGWYDSAVGAYDIFGRLKGSGGKSNAVASAASSSTGTTAATAASDAAAKSSTPWLGWGALAVGATAAAAAGAYAARDPETRSKISSGWQQASEKSVQGKDALSEKWSAGKESIMSGWTWTSEHLEFVGCLARGEELRTRFHRTAQLTQAGNKEKSAEKIEEGQSNEASAKTLGGLDPVGLAVLYSMLPKKSDFLENRTFCNLPSGLRKPWLSDKSSESDSSVPKSENQVQQEQPEAMESGANQQQKSVEKKGGTWEKLWHACENTAAPNEVEAHVGMFATETNPGFEKMALQARDLITDWTVDFARS